MEKSEKYKEKGEKEMSENTLTSFEIRKGNGDTVNVRHEKIENGYLVTVDSYTNKPDKKGSNYSCKKFYSETPVLESEFIDKTDTKAILTSMGYKV